MILASEPSVASKKENSGQGDLGKTADTRNAAQQLQCTCYAIRNNICALPPLQRQASGMLSYFMMGIIIDISLFIYATFRVMLRNIFQCFEVWAGSHICRNIRKKIKSKPVEYVCTTPRYTSHLQE